MPFDKFTLRGADYPLGHLRGFRVIVPAKDPLLSAASLQVTFSCHVYSEKWDETIHDEEHKFTEDGQDRSFCPVRYGCSMKIEAIVRGGLEGKVYWGRDGNGVLNSFFYGEADGIPYPVYFRLNKAHKINGVDGLMHIISAYQNPKLPARHRIEAIKFARLVHRKCPPKT
jgi:hypothetical protein